MGNNSPRVCEVTQTERLVYPLGLGVNAKKDKKSNTRVNLNTNYDSLESGSLFILVLSSSTLPER